MRNHSFFIIFIITIILITSPANAETLKRGIAWKMALGELDPHNISSDTLFSLIAHYIEPLVKLNPDDKIIPALAERWEVNPSSTEFTLYLRKDARWSSGHPITAVQVKQSINRALSKDKFSDAKILLMPIKGVKERLINENYDYPLGIEIIDQHTIKIFLTESRSDFLRSLAFPFSSPIPLHQLKNDKLPPITEIDSSGPYKVISKSKHSIKFINRPDYYGSAPHFTDVEILFDEYGPLADKFLSKEIDTVEFISVEQVPWIRRNIPKTLSFSRSFGAFYMVFKDTNFGGLPAEIRKIMYPLIDSKRVNELVNEDYFSEFNGLIPWEDLPESMSISDNTTLDEKKKVMEKYGYSKDNPLKACINMRKLFRNERLFNYFRALWKDIYVDLDLQILNDDFEIPVENQMVRINGRNACQMILEGYGTRTKTSEELIAIFTPGGLFYPYLSVSEDLKNLYQQLSGNISESERKGLLRKMESMLLENHYAKGLYSAGLIALANPEKITNLAKSKTQMTIPLTEYIRPSSNPSLTSNKSISNIETRKKQGHEINFFHSWQSPGEQGLLALLKEEIKLRGGSFKNYQVGEFNKHRLQVARIENNNLSIAPLWLEEGNSLRELDTLGLLSNLSSLSSQKSFQTVLFDEVTNEITLNDKFVSLPLNIHLWNRIYYNAAIYDELGLKPAQSMAELLAQMNRIKKAGYTPLITGNDPIQLSSLLYSIILDKTDISTLYSLFWQKNQLPNRRKQLIEIFQTLRSFSKFTDAEHHSNSWDTNTWLLAEGQAAIQVSADFAKGELNSLGYQPTTHYYCAFTPGSKDVLLYNVEVIALMKPDDPYADSSWQFLSDTLLDADVQTKLVGYKGGLPVRKDIDSSQLDDCTNDAYGSWVSSSRRKKFLIPNNSHFIMRNIIHAASIVWKYPQANINDVVDQLIASIEAGGN